jgi:signal transduction histidine kinase
MLHKFYLQLHSLRVRLILTYVMVTAFSFGLLLLLIMTPVESFLKQREEDTLSLLATTLASTIRTPWRDSAGFQQDLRWTQLRTSELSGKLGIHFRILDATGRPLTDSAYPWTPIPDPWPALKKQLAAAPSLSARDEVRHAMSLRFSANTVPRGGATRLFVAQPVERAYGDGTTQRSALAFIMYLEKQMDSISTDLRQLQSYLVTGMIVSLLITIMVSIMLSNHLSSRLHAAMQVARAFAGGRMDSRMPAYGYDEVGQLGRAFNHMAGALQRQEQLRRDLLADVSHELRTPLTAISGCADTLSDGALRDDPETAERFLAIIHREAQRLQRLVRDILELSKLQARAVDIPLTPIHLCPLIEEAIEIAGMHTATQEVTIACHFPQTVAGEALCVLANEDRLMQALRNILDNARHHTPVGRVITVQTEATPDTVIVHVRDEGEGIPPEELPWVFDRFYRTGKGTKTSEGTGLGLAIVREIMLAHDGKVTVESWLKSGTTFSLHLKRVQAESAMDAPIVVTGKIVS